MLRLGSAKAILFAVSLLVASSAFPGSLNDGFVAFKQGDKQLAHKNWLPLAIQGNVKAQFLLSVLYEQWTERSEDQKNARKWLMAAANNGFIPAQFNLGNNYRQGRYGMVSNKMAVYWWEQAAVQGFVDAQYHLATIYYQGDGIQRNPKEAMYWFRKAADNGYPEATAVLVEIRAGRLGRMRKGREVANISYDDPMIISPQQSTTSASVTLGGPTDKIAESTKTDADSSVEDSGPAQKIEAPQVVNKQETESSKTEQPPASDQGWVTQQPAVNYTIQLVASGRMRLCEGYVKQLRERYQLETHAHAFALKGRKLCSVIYGSYGRFAKAKDRLKQLPRKIRRDNKPWIRKLGGLQELAR
jgi:Sel1 repeat/SPOR domain